MPGLVPGIYVSAVLSKRKLPRDAMAQPLDIPDGENRNERKSE
jgi:hypothetical protein